MQSTPENKRVTWKPVVQEVHFSVVDEQEESQEDSGSRHSVRWDFIKQCEREIRDDSFPAKGGEVSFPFVGDCPANFEDGPGYPREEIELETVKGGRGTDTLQDTSAALIDTEVPLSQQNVDNEVPLSQHNVGVESVSFDSSHIALQDVVIDAGCAGGLLSEADKHAAMKRRYSMLQESQKMPIEEERRLKRERLRGLVPVWRPKKAN